MILCYFYLYVVSFTGLKTFSKYIVDIKTNKTLEEKEH